MADMPPEDAVLYRDLKKTYPTVVRGEGVYLYDADRKSVV